MPGVPTGLAVSAAISARHRDAWLALQAGNLRRAEQEFRALTRQNPAFYPAEAGLGFVLLAGRRYREAEPHFRTATTSDPRYLPGWVGRAESLVALGRDREAIDALERVLTLSPGREVAKTRLEFLRLRMTQGAMDRARRARSAGRLDVAERELEAALVDAPGSALILGELATVELAARRLDEAEAHARRAIQIEPAAAERHALLGDILEAGSKYRDAATAYTRAVALNPKPEWRERVTDLREKATNVLLPASFARLSSAATVTRAETAAFIGIHLETLLARAPARAVDVATDIRAHWAATWIVPVTRAGIMTIYPNHTFQPSATVRRSDLASIVASLVRLAGTSRRAELTRWQAAWPRFTDLAAGHLAYGSAALAVASGAMAVDADGRFEPTRAVTGRELDAAVRRIDAIATSEP